MAILFENLSNIIIPVLIFWIVATGLSQKLNVYEIFVKGAKKGISTVGSILPTLIGLMISVGILRSSGFLNFLGDGIGKGLSSIGFPGELVPLVIVRMFSSSAATGLALDLFKQFGTDSYIGKVTSIMMSSTETIFYTMSVYFLITSVKKTRWTLPGAMIATVAGLVASMVFARFM